MHTQPRPALSPPATRAQDQLVKICISGGEPLAGYQSTSAKLAQAPYDSGLGELGEVSMRALLAATYECPEGKEPLWPATLIHKIHILIFLISINHSAASCICGLRVRVQTLP